MLGVISKMNEGLSTFSLDTTGIAVVQSWVNHSAVNYGFIIKDYSDASDGLDFSSRENGTTSKRPKLTVTYSTGPVETAVGSSDLPGEFHLKQNYPNPFNPTTTISYSLPKSDFVTLKIYDLLGKEVLALVNEFQEAGTHSIDFDASKLSSGAYLYPLRSGEEFVETKKMLLIK